ncbi:hypothetical protein V9T40_004907 [Parthenolecanium corni]|uniref:Suppressor APC domain-containing protein n=1 Tax=Parthenolecanium corni TaxID=536013 RepID=A0AAN9TEY4_9HEMI
MLPSPPATSAKNRALDGLPKSFIHILRTLFDILDNKQTGLVKFSDIEARWQEDSAADLPKGVIDSLRKVTPPNGLLSFEQFCAGLKISLLRNQMESRSKPGDDVNRQMKQLAQRPPSAPILEVFDSKCNINENANQWSKCPMPPGQISNSVRQNQLRTLSMPQLNPEGNSGKDENKEAAFQNKHIGNSALLGPPKPPRTNIGGAAFFPQRPLESGKTDKTEIRAALQNWQLGLMSEDKMGYRNLMNRNVPVTENNKGVIDYQESQPHKKLPSRRREPRRHTLQNGVDCNMLKKIKQIESEKEVLVEGLQAVERAREWYRKQLAIVQDKMKYVCRSGSQEQWSEAQQERIELLRARILEVNRHLATLGGNSGDSNKNVGTDRDGLPLHMNLAVHSQSRISQAQVLSQLKRQNHVLSREITHKTERINNLEREKAALIRELYQVRRKSDQPVGKPQSGSETVPMAPAAYI